MKLTLDQIANLYKLEPYQRELLELMVRRDEAAKAKENAFRESLLSHAEAEFNAIVEWLKTQPKDTNK
jgi:hypothetical protein